eukprot:707628-Amphidinium_carterae.1
MPWQPLQKPHPVQHKAWCEEHKTWLFLPHSLTLHPGTGTGSFLLGAACTHTKSKFMIRQSLSDLDPATCGTDSTNEMRV